MLKWKRICEGCWHGFHPGEVNPAAIVERNDFGRYLWKVEIVGSGSLVDKGYDCFSFKLAKKLASQRLCES